ncbi:MAG: alpha/beta hydrolase [Bacillota bacterium]|nr:alpha/beta hydrolase [Bacillota bacterium]
MFIDSIYMSSENETKLMSIYNKQLLNLKVNYESKMINTRFGYTYLLATGPKDAEPVIFFHAANCTNPFCLQWFLPIAKKYRVYSPDIIGQPGRSSQTQLSCNDDSYGAWAADIIRELGLEKCHCLGSSFGGGILLKLAAYAPQLIKSASLIVPTTISNIPSIQSLKIALYSLSYGLSSSKKKLCKILQPLCDEIDDNMLEMAEAFYKNTKLRINPPNNIGKSNLENFQAPVLIIAAEKDVLFPGKEMIEKAKKIIPNVIAAELLEGSPHMFAKPSERLDYVNNRILSFLENVR